MKIGKKLEQWENARIDGLISKLLLIVMVMANLFLLTRIVRANKRITIVPPVTDKGFWIDETSASKEYLLEMGEYFVTYVLTATPRSIETKIKNFERYLDPRSYGVIKNDLYARAEKMKRNNISQAFLPDNTVMGRKQKVVVSGTLKRFVGAVETTSERKSCTIGFTVKNGEIYVNSFETT